MVRITWDPRKRTVNVKKHGIEFEEAATVLADALGTTFPDVDHSEAKQRCLTIGVSARGRVLVVSHADAGDVIRIISARRGNPARADLL